MSRETTLALDVNKEGFFFSNLRQNIHLCRIFLVLNLRNTTKISLRQRLLFTFTESDFPMVSDRSNLVG